MIIWKIVHASVATQKDPIEFQVPAPNTSIPHCTPQTLTLELKRKLQLLEILPDGNPTKQWKWSTRRKKGGGIQDLTSALIANCCPKPQCSDFTPFIIKNKQLMWFPCYTLNLVAQRLSDAMNTTGLPAPRCQPLSLHCKCSTAVLTSGFQGDVFLTEQMHTDKAEARRVFWWIAIRYEYASSYIEMLVLQL